MTSRDITKMADNTRGITNDEQKTEQMASYFLLVVTIYYDTNIQDEDLLITWLDSTEAK